MVLFYDLGIRLFLAGIWLAAPFHAKARKWIRGRRKWRQDLQAVRAAFGNAPTVWIHCASLGEFEQGRPLIEQLKQRAPNVRILLTFFSPSGYEVRKNYSLADAVIYLPLDTARNAADFVSIAQPQLAIFIKYEFWHHYLKRLKEEGAHLLLVSAIFRPNQVFFQPYGKFFRKILNKFNWIFVQDSASQRLLTQHEVLRCSVNGDTRVDRVAAVALSSVYFPVVEQFGGGHKLLVAGSTWPEDEDILLSFVNEMLPMDWKVIIAPHQIGTKQINRILSNLRVPSLSYSLADLENATDQRVLVIDNIGMLAGLYRYGQIAYIGGGFGSGIHNTLEPMAFGLPVIFGPKYHKFREAVEMIDCGGAFSIRDIEEFTAVFDRLSHPVAYTKAKEMTLDYIRRNEGATVNIIDYLKKNSLLLFS